MAAFIVFNDFWYMLGTCLLLFLGLIIARPYCDTTKLYLIIARHNLFVCIAHFKMFVFKIMWNLNSPRLFTAVYFVLLHDKNVFLYKKQIRLKQCKAWPLIQFVYYMEMPE